MAQPSFRRTQRLNRILHSLNLDTVGGVESIFGDYLKNEESTQFEHHLMILNRRCHPFFIAAVEQRIKSLFYAKYAGPLYLPKLMRKRWAVYRSSRLKPDVHIIYNTLDNPSAWTANQFAKTRIYYERGAAWLDSKTNDVITQNIRQPHRIFCNSLAAQRVLMLRYGVDPKRCDVIYNPMRLGAQNSCIEPSSKKERFRIGMAGRVIPVKGMVIALHALAELLKKQPAFELVIAGDGPELGKLREVANDLNLGTAIRFLGVVQNMDSFYTSLDVFVCPSLREPLGNVAIEANGRGCPVICTQVDGLPEAIVPGRTGICLRPALSQDDYFALGVQGKSLPEHVYDPFTDCLKAPSAISPSQLVEAIWQLFQSPERRGEMAKEAFKLSRERFSLEGYVKNLHALIHKAQLSSAEL
jgi:glycosyltransferase involved in cell wall biosynthesis